MFLKKEADQHTLAFTPQTTLCRVRKYLLANYQLDESVEVAQINRRDTSDIMEAIHHHRKHTTTHRMFTRMECTEGTEHEHL